MTVYESEHTFSLKSVFYFFLMLWLVDLAFRWAVWVGVVLSVVLCLSFLNYQLKTYSLTKQIEKEINRRNVITRNTILSEGCS